MDTSNMYDTILQIAERWELQSMFDDKADALSRARSEIKIQMLEDGTMVGHTPRWTAVVDVNGFTCSCPDHQYRKSQCKHLGAMCAQIKEDWQKEFEPKKEKENV